MHGRECSKDPQIVQAKRKVVLDELKKNAGLE